ncbi:hypothetical protein [Nocardioides sp. GY 10127]|uniref:hypothetical protein n=1 Tax=Nocardioides sp. GY 10127 TaxID=2569762 RepID=UPI0010A7FBA7|nr:hypothetical protein [Nocardioides sp. GY 10127]TIC86401.1 hypothetical protein E8D37_00360 [Nocardioides sp. GY 10127]
MTTMFSPVGTDALVAFRQTHRRTWDLAASAAAHPGALEHLESRYTSSADEHGRVLVRDERTGHVETFATRDIHVVVDVLLTREIEAAQALDRAGAGAGAHRGFRPLGFVA